MPGSPLIYFHVGLSKTGTTFLQSRVFPQLQGISYIPTQHYKQAVRRIRRKNASKFLVSREFDQQFEQEIRHFSRQFPDAIPIIVFRRQDSYIASQYRRFVKNGFSGPFEAFFNLQDDQGYFKQQDLDYPRHLRLLREHFSAEPQVYLYEDLRLNPNEFYQRWAFHTQSQIDLDQLDSSPVHTSYTEGQLLFIRRINRYLNLRKRPMSRLAPLHFLLKLLREGVRYLLLFLGRWSQSAQSEVLIPAEQLEKIQSHYAPDWDQIRTEAQRWYLSGK